MGRDHAHEEAPLVMRLAHKTDVAEAEVAEPAVDELRRGARRRPGEISFSTSGDLQTVRARRFGDAGADDAASDDEQVEAHGAESF